MVQAREGSFVEIIVITTIVAREFFRGIRHYPTFRKGLLEFLDDARECGRAIRSTIVKQRTLEDRQIQASRVTRGHLMQLHRLYRRVEEGEMSAEDAHEKAVDLFRWADEKVSKDLSDALLEFFKGAPTQEIRLPPRPGGGRRAAAVRPRRRLIYRRGVELERKPGEKKIWTRPWSGLAT